MFILKLELELDQQYEVKEKETNKCLHIYVCTYGPYLVNVDGCGRKINEIYFKLDGISELYVLYFK
jgi:hypothetical protein